MDIQIVDALDEEKRTEWNEFYDSVIYQHPRQSPIYSHVDERHYQAVRYAIGRINGQIVACGAFALSAHPYLKGVVREARCMCGPLCNDAELMFAFISQLSQHPKFRYVGQICISPYWLEDEARILNATAGREGWKDYEQRGEYRKTGVIDLTLSHDELLAHCSASARKHYRKAIKMKVESRNITTTEGANRLYEIMEFALGGRNISLYSHKYYMDLFESVLKGGSHGVLMGSYIGDEMLGGCMNFRSSIAGIGRILVMDTPRINAHGNLRLSPFILMNSFMWAQKHGCTRFDLEGYEDPEKSPKTLKNVHEYKSKMAPKPVVRFAEHKKINNTVIHVSGNMKQIAKSNLRVLRRKLKREQA